MVYNSVNEDGEQSPKVKLLISSITNESLDSLPTVKKYIWELQSSHHCVPTEKLRRTLNDEPVLLKWLNLYPNNPRKAAERILSTLEWREVNKVDKILEENYIEYLRAVTPVHFGSVDNWKRPIVYIPLNHWTLDKICLLERSGDFHRFALSFFEQVTQKCNQNQATMKSSTAAFSVIVNFEGVSVLKLANLKLLWRISATFSTIFERYYLYSLLRFVVINCVSHLNMKILRFILLRQFAWKKCFPSALHLYLKQDSKRSTHFLRSIISSEELPVACGGWKQLSEDVVDITSLTFSS